jgi:Family of unknown function (DUF6335)
VVAGTPFATSETVTPRDGSEKTGKNDRNDDLEGPPPREATYLRGDREREAEREAAEHTSTSPKLSGGDVDADWQRGEADGEETVGGTVATPDQSVVDELGEALGVPRAPDEEVRTSEEILEGRDTYRWEQEDNERE